MNNDLERAINTTEEKYQCLALNTAHLAKGDTEALDNAVITTGMTLKRDFGWFVKLYEEPEYIEELPLTDNIKSIMLMALDRGFRLIEFDCDAQVLPGLPTFGTTETKAKVVSFATHLTTAEAIVIDGHFLDQYTASDNPDVEKPFVGVIRDQDGENWVFEFSWGDVENATFDPDSKTWSVGQYKVALLKYI